MKPLISALPVCPVLMKGHSSLHRRFALSSRVLGSPGGVVAHGQLRRCNDARWRRRGRLRAERALTHPATSHQLHSHNTNTRQKPPRLIQIACITADSLPTLPFDCARACTGGPPILTSIGRECAASRLASIDYRSSVVSANPPRRVLAFSGVKARYCWASYAILPSKHYCPSLACL